MFFFNDTATTEIYTLSLHDALPICVLVPFDALDHDQGVLEDVLVVELGVLLDVHRLHELRDDVGHEPEAHERPDADRKSTRLNSSHANISYAVFCLKKKKFTVVSCV